MHPPLAQEQHMSEAGRDLVDVMRDQDAGRRVVVAGTVCVSQAVFEEEAIPPIACKS